MDVEFQRLIRDLRKAGFTDAQLAGLCKCTKQHIGKIGNGEVKKVGYEIGRKLTQLHDAVY